MKYKIARITIIGILCTCLIGYLLSHYDGKEYSIENAEDYVRRVCEISNVPGMSIVVLDNEQEYYMNVGYADKDEKAAMTSAVRYLLWEYCGGIFSLQYRRSINLDEGPDGDIGNK